MKKPSDHIFQLVHAMSPAEKRYFRLHFASEASQLTVLFDVLNRMKTYNEETLKSKLGESVAKNIKVYKIQLQDLLLKSLSSYHSKRTVLSKVRLWLEEADILAEKQLFDQALDRLAKAKAVCKHYEEFTYLLEISAREFHLKHVSNDRLGISTHPYFEETLDFIRHIQTALNYHKQSTDWVDYIARFHYRPPNEKEERTACDILQRESKVHTGELSFRARLSRNTLLMSLYKLVKDATNEGDARRGNVELFQAFPQFQETMPFQYIATLRNLMNFALGHKDYDTGRYCVEAGLEFIHKNPASASQKVYFHYGVLEMSFECRLWESILHDWEQPVVQNLKEQGIAKERIAMLCYIYFAVSCQILNKSAKVQHYLRLAAECREEVRSHFAELLILLDLVNHYEAGDDFLVAKRIKALKRKEQGDNAPGSALLQEFLALLTSKNPEERRRMAAELSAQAPQWEKSVLGWSLKKNGLLYWLQAVADGRPLHAYMQTI